MNVYKVTSVVLLGLIALLVACSTSNQTAEKKSPAASSENKTLDNEHQHVSGSHGGSIVAIGRENYHGEIVFESTGTIRMFMLQADEGKIQDVDQQTLTAYILPHGETNSIAIQFEPQPQDGDSANKTSQFVAKLPAELVGRTVRCTIPNLKIGTDRFRVAFDSPEPVGATHGDTDMPIKVANDAERDLYLTPGGAYTDADIKANGNVTASQKFQGFQAKHDMNPKKGDRICPITETKTNPICSWVINGQTYEFCCPPCVDEFVKLAKANPSEIKDAVSYVKSE